MTPKRMHWLLVGVLAVTLLGFFGAAYGILEMLKNESTVLITNRSKLSGLDQEQVRLAKAKKDLADNKELYQISKSIVPQSKDQTQAVRQVVALASANRVRLQSITFPASTLGTATGTGTGSAATASNTSSPNNKFSQLTPVKNIPGVYTLELTVTSDPNNLATYADLINFLSALEKNRQTALVSTISITPSPDATGYFSFSLTMNIYIKP